MKSISKFLSKNSVFGGGEIFNIYEFMNRHVFVMTELARCFTYTTSLSCILLNRLIKMILSHNTAL